ncbi:MAG: DUF3604 domain-containing protein [Candidatus Hydrogenedentota bacterium]
MGTKARFAIALAVAQGLVFAQDQAGQRNLYFGDTHLHTYNSPDAFLMQNRAVSPDDAYRFAKGEFILHPYTKAKIRIGTPLDFLVVSDHAEAIGVIRAVFEGDSRIAETPFGKFLLDAAARGEELEAFTTLVASTNQRNQPGQPPSSKFGPEAIQGILQISRSVWADTTEAADRHNAPGKFTTFLGWEWTSAPDGANLHRVVFMKEDQTVGKQFQPYSTLQSSDPEDLWNWLQTTSIRTGANFIAIPHNANLSKGKMFDVVDSDGIPITEAYARTRMRWEPVVEATQVKGDSETHPVLSPTDEFADYEKYGYLLQAGRTEEYKEVDAGAYLRSSLIRGLALEQQVGVNPYKFGMIGSTDSHTGASTSEENNFWGKFGIDSIPANKDQDVLAGAKGNDMGAAGVAAVWAEENTRESIFDAFRRKEVYATTGPRIRVRFFGGWDFDTADAAEPDIAVPGYAKGVPMGGDLTNAPEGKAPMFLVHAVKDPVEANLDRVQIVKGWVDSNGGPHEKIFDIALSDGRVEKDSKVDPVGNTVDLKTALYTNSIGDAQLAAVWKDPEFDPAVRAVYYARVLQVPTPRHTLYDAVAAKREPAAGKPTTIQERAYTSPIWYTPS